MPHTGSASPGDDGDEFPTEAATPTAAERLLTSVVRWRAPLRVALASGMTAAVVAVFTIAVVPDTPTDVATDASAPDIPDGPGTASERPAVGEATSPQAPDAVDPSADPGGRPDPDRDREPPVGPTRTDPPSPGGDPGGAASVGVGRSPKPKPKPSSESGGAGDTPDGDGAPPGPTWPTVAGPTSPNAAAGSIDPADPAAPATTEPLTSITGTTVLVPAPGPVDLPQPTSPSPPTSVSATSAPTSSAPPPASAEPDRPRPDPTNPDENPAPTPAEPGLPGERRSRRPARFEVEDGALLGTAAARADHDGHSGSGFVGDLITEGSGVAVTVTATEAGPTPFTVRYAAGSNGPADGRTLTVYVNGDQATRAEMALTDDWSTWDVVVGELDLIAGDNVITLVWDPGDTGWVNLDYVQLN